MFRKRTGVLLLVCIGLLLYINSLSNGFLGDDHSQVLDNQQVHSVSSLGNFFLGSTYYNGGLSRLTGLYYRPLMLTSYAVIYTLFGPNPFPFHMVQVAIHVINSTLLFSLFGVFFSLPAAFLLSLLFLIHPINNEAVVYIANLQDVLFVLFGLIATLFLVSKTKQNVSWKTAGTVGFFTLLSLFTKETGIVFVGILVLYAFLYIKRYKQRIYFSLGASLLTYLFFRYFLAGIGITKTQAVAPIATAGIGIKFITLPAIIATYLKTFFFPLSLSSSHYWVVTSITSPDFYLSVLIDGIFCLAVFLTAKWIIRKHKKYSMQFFFFLAWFVFGLIPHLQLIPLDTTIAERWFYFSAIGIIGIIGTVAQCISIKNANIKKLMYGGIVVLFILLGIRTFVRNFDWVDGITLYSHDIKTTKASFLLDNALATELLMQGYYKEAKPYVFSSIKSYPFYANLNNAAIISLSEKNIPQTKYYLQQALTHFGNYAVYENYANFLLVYYSPKETVTFAKEALKKYPNDPKILFDYGKASYLLGDTKTALEAVKKSYAILPGKKTEELIITIEAQMK